MFFVIVLFFYTFCFNSFASYLNNYDIDCKNTKTENETLDLLDLLTISICNNPSLKSEYLSIKSSEKELSKNKSEYLPTIAVGVSASKTNTKIENYNTTNNNPYSGSIGLSWLLFDFGARGNRINTLKEYVNIAKYSYNTKLYNMVLSVSEAYFNMLSAKETLKSQIAIRDMYSKSYEESKKKYELGMISLSDELQAKTSYENSSLSVIKAKNTVEQRKGDLAILLNLSPSVELNLSDNFNDKDDIINIENNDIEYLMNLAIKNRSELKKKESEIKIAENNVNLAKKGFLPTLKLSASTSYNDKWKGSNLYTRESNVGLNLEIPIFEGFSTLNNVYKTKYEQKKAIYSYEDTKNSIRNEVWSAYKNYKTSIDRYNESEILLKSSEENYKVAFKSYEIGKIDIVSLLEASSKLASSKLERIDAFYSVLINKVNLYRTIGEF